MHQGPTRERGLGSAGVRAHVTAPAPFMLRQRAVGVAENREHQGIDTIEANGGVMAAVENSVIAVRLFAIEREACFDVLARRLDVADRPIHPTSAVMRLKQVTRIVLTFPDAEQLRGATQRDFTISVNVRGIPRSPDGREQFRRLAVSRAS